MSSISVGSFSRRSEAAPQAPSSRRPRVEPIATTRNLKVLLIDPSEKGALPLYTGMVAAGLSAVGAAPVILASRHLVSPKLDLRNCKVLRWLPTQRWPRPAGSPDLSQWRQALTWLSCAMVIFLAVLFIRPRVVHFEYPIHIRLDSLLLRLLRLFVPVVWTAHDTLPHDPGTNIVERVKRIYSLADLVLVHSVPAAEDVQRLARVRSILVNHPVRPLDQPPDRASARRQLGLAPDARIAVAIGFIRAYKGYGLLAEIWTLLGDKAPTLLVMGELVDESERGAIRRLQAHPRADVRLGYASESDVVAAFAAADVVLLPHERGSDSGSLHLARAVGVPVISSDAPQLSSVVAATSAGVSLPRDPVRWANVLTGALPAPPLPAPPLSSTGIEHLAAYDQARKAWRGGRQRGKQTPLRPDIAALVNLSPTPNRIDLDEVVTTPGAPDLQRVDPASIVGNDMVPGGQSAPPDGTVAIAMAPTSLLSMDPSPGRRVA